MNTMSPWWLLVILPVALFAFPHYGARLLRKLECKMRRHQRPSVCPACRGCGCEFCGLPPPVDYVAMWIKYAMDNRCEAKTWVHTMSMGARHCRKLRKSSVLLRRRSALQRDTRVTVELWLKCYTKTYLPRVPVLWPKRLS